MRILIVEDNDLVGDGLQRGLKAMGFAPDWVTDGMAASHALITESFAAVVLDLGLPKLGGLDLLKRIRLEQDLNVPVLILTARDEVADCIGGLDAGADDYLVKPCDLGELAARLRALIRRADGKASPVIRIGDLQIDPAAHQVSYEGRAIDLPAREFALLHELAREPGRIVSRDALAARLYPWGSEIESNAIEVHIHHLRRKISPGIIRTVRGVGYLVPRALP